MRDRLTTEEKAIRVLEAKVAELERWRPDIEERIKVRTKQVNKQFEHHSDVVEAFKGVTKAEFDIIANN